MDFTNQPFINPYAFVSVSLIMLRIILVVQVEFFNAYHFIKCGKIYNYEN